MHEICLLSVLQDAIPWQDYQLSFDNPKHALAHPTSYDFT